MSADDRGNTINQSDKFLVHMGGGNGEQMAYMHYSNEKLEETLDEVIAFIKKTQKMFM